MKFIFKFLNFSVKKTKLSLEQINTWFTNTRRKYRRLSEKEIREEMFTDDEPIVNALPNYLQLYKSIPEIQFKPYENVEKTNNSSKLLVENLGSE